MAAVVHLQSICSALSCVPIGDMVLIALVTLLLDCCNALYLRLPLISIWKLQVAQNTAIEMFMGIFQYAYIPPLLVCQDLKGPGFCCLGNIILQDPGEIPSLLLAFAFGTASPQILLAPTLHAL